MKINPVKAYREEYPRKSQIKTTKEWLLRRGLPIAGATLTAAALLSVAGCRDYTTDGTPIFNPDDLSETDVSCTDVSDTEFILAGDVVAVPDCEE